MTTQLNSDLARRFTWGGMLTLVTVAGTLAVACGTPFVALGTLGALFLPRRDAFLLVGINWVVNQAIGFTWLHYPHTWECYAGGAHLALAAGLCTVAAMFVGSRLRRTGAALRAMGAFAAAFVIYESVLFAISPFNSVKDFALPIVVYIFCVNAIAFVGLLLIKTAAPAFGFALPVSKSPASARAIP